VIGVTLDHDGIRHSQIEEYGFVRYDSDAPGEQRRPSRFSLTASTVRPMTCTPPYLEPRLLTRNGNFVFIEGRRQHGDVE
jgi:hypothetical protein